MSNKKSLLKKRRRRSIIAFEMIRLDRTSTEPLHQQLYRQIRDELRSGSFSDGASRLPSSRALAVDLGISRLTVNLAFSKLHAEGYLRSKAKSGTFAAYPLPDTFLSADKFARPAAGRIPHGGPKAHPATESTLRISDRVKAIPDQRVGKQFDLGATGAGAGVSLVPSIPAVDEFPIGVWERLRAQVLAKKGTHLLRYASNRGDLDLRNALAAYLCDFRAARCHNAFVFEDDYDAEFRFTGPPLPSLQGMDNSGRVIYAGTMSKILCPSLRLGYIVAPEPLIDSLIKIRSAMDQHSSPIDQATLARFITEGFFLSHIKRMRKIYSDRRDFFIEEFNKLLGNRFRLQVPEAGLNIVAWLKREEDFPIIRHITIDIGVRPSTLSFFCIQAKLKPAFVFGFAAWTSAQIRESLVKLASALKAEGI